MNGRLFAKRFFGSILFLLGAACLFGDGQVGTKMLAFAAFGVPALLLFRKSRKDAEWAERYRKGELTGQVVAKAVSDSAKDAHLAEGRASYPVRAAKRAAVGATALHVAASPFIILGKLLKMQK